MINPYTENIYLIGGYHTDSIEVEIFDPNTQSIHAQKPSFGQFIGGSSVEIYDGLLLNIGGYDTQTYDQLDSIYFAEIPQNSSVHLVYPERTKIELSY